MMMITYINRALDINRALLEQFCFFSSVSLYKCENVVARGSELLQREVH